MSNDEQEDETRFYLERNYVIATIMEYCEQVGVG